MTLTCFTLMLGKKQNFDVNSTKNLVSSLNVLQKQSWMTLLKNVNDVSIYIILLFRLCLKLTTVSWMLEKTKKEDLFLM